MTSEGQLYTSKKVLPSFVLPPYAAYIEQTCPIKMNCEQTLTAVATSVDFIPSDDVDGIPSGLLEISIDRLQKAFVLLIGRTVNTFAGQNYLDCSTATDNQWQINVDGGDYVDLENNGKADGQMLDTDWLCVVQAIIHPFTFMFDITSLVTLASNRFGVRLQNARSLQNNLVVTVDIYAKYVWRLQAVQE